MDDIDGNFGPNSSIYGASDDTELLDQQRSDDAQLWFQTVDVPEFLHQSFLSYNSMSLSPVPRQDTHHQEYRRWEPGSSSIYGALALSLNERLRLAMKNVIALTGSTNTLVQIWVPMREGLKNYLTTLDQPHTYDLNSDHLINYRLWSERFRLSADEDSREGCHGLPGRVFLGKMPEWTPDVRFFKEDDCPRVNHAKICDVRGSIALPVIDKESDNCLGVIEIVTTTQKITYLPEVQAVCIALEAVNLRSCEILIPANEKGGNESQTDELLEILHMIQTVCDKHGLPLGQTWASDNKSHCASIVGIACYVRDQRVSHFHEACSHIQLLRGQGIVGRAFETNRPCYSVGITIDSPLHHQAEEVGLHGVVALQLQCLRSTSQAYVLEFFLPIDCQHPGITLHCKIMESLTMMLLDSQRFRKEFSFSPDGTPRRENNDLRVRGLQNMENQATERYPGFARKGKHRGRGRRRRF